MCTFLNPNTLLKDLFILLQLSHFGLESISMAHLDLAIFAQFCLQKCFESVR